MPKGNAWACFEEQFLAETFVSEEWTVQQIAETLDRPANAITSKARVMGLCRPDKGGGQPEYNYGEIKQLIAQRMRYADIAEAVGCAESTVSRVARRLKREAMGAEDYDRQQWVLAAKKLWRRHQHTQNAFETIYDALRSGALSVPRPGEEPPHG